MEINKVVTGIIDMPLKRPHKMSMDSPNKINIILVMIESKSGVVGLGETITFNGPTWSEESAESVQETINNYLAPHILNQDPIRFEYIRQCMEDKVRGNYFAKSAIEMALFDLVGKQRNLPAYNLIGGKVQDKIPLSWSIAGASVDEELKEIDDMLTKGINIFKIKTGALPLEEDLARIKTIRNALKHDIKLRIDANQGWNYLEAKRAIIELMDHNIEFCEQPIASWDLNGLYKLANESTIPLMADESLSTVYDAVTLSKLDAVNVFGIKLSKAGGLLGAKRIAAVAEGSGINCYVGSMIDSGIGTSAHTHFAASTPSVNMGCELFGPLLLSEDIVNEKTRYKDGHIYVNDTAGLGVTLNETIIEKYKRKDFTVIK